MGTMADAEVDMDALWREQELALLVQQSEEGTDAPDGFGGKRKVPLRSLDQNAAAKRRRPSSNQVLSPHFGAAARSGKVPSARGGSGAIKLNGEALDPNRHAGLTMGHFFGRDR